MDNQSLWAVRIWGANCQMPLSRHHSRWYKHDRTKSVVSRTPGACLLAQASGSVVQQLLPAQGTNPAGLHLLLAVIYLFIYTALIIRLLLIDRLFITVSILLHAIGLFRWLISSGFNFHWLQAAKTLWISPRFSSLHDYNNYFVIIFGILFIDISGFVPILFSDFVYLGFFLSLFCLVG
jgi:hypothetical protein